MVVISHDQSPGKKFLTRTKDQLSSSSVHVLKL